MQFKVSKKGKDVSEKYVLSPDGTLLELMQYEDPSPVHGNELKHLKIIFDNLEEGR